MAIDNGKPGHLEQLCIDTLDQRIRKVGAELRRLADQMDRRADELPNVGGSRHPNYGNLVSAVQCDIKHAVFGLALDGLVCSAADVDDLRWRRIAGETIAHRIEAEYANNGADDGADGAAIGAVVAREYATKEA